MLSLDDYFMVEVEKKETDPDTGKKVTRKVGRCLGRKEAVSYTHLTLPTNRLV